MRGDALLRYPAEMPTVFTRPCASSYLDLTGLVFKHCVENFQGAALTSKEKKCISSLSKKWLGSSARATMRFAELQHDFLAKQLLEPVAPGGAKPLA